MIKALMVPDLPRFGNMESGVKRVVEAYHRYAKDYGIEFVECRIEDEKQYDVMIIHAGSSDRYPVHRPLVACCHGLYWTDDYEAATWEWETNASVIESIRRSTKITVPSEWVAETIRRDFRVDPVVLPHGIEWKDWLHSEYNGGYVLWNKNRPGDVCSTQPVTVLAERRPDVKVLTTFADNSAPGNVSVIGLKSHGEMKKVIQRAAVYLASTKETFGIGTLEAMASGVPVLGFAQGGNNEIIQHGQTGYLAQPGNYDDLVRGLDFCLQYRDTLSHNCKIVAKQFSWDKPMRIFTDTLQSAIDYWKDRQRPLKVNPGK